jgi:biotin-dependent carboxylase-like uncharacterized protein
MGPFDGRPLAAGDRLPVGVQEGEQTPSSPVPLPLPEGGARLRVIPGPHMSMFSKAAYDALFGNRYVVTPNSNRMGYRLEGVPLEHAGPADVLSDATPIGSIQVPASGQPILLMADRQTTGGYPRIGTLITADLPAAGQLAPGDWIEFAACSREAAVDALGRQHALLRSARR